MLVISLASRMAARNPGTDFDPSWIQNVYVNLASVKRRSEQIGTRRTVKKQWQAAWELRAVSCIDLTTLSGDDTLANVNRLCFKAKNPVMNDLIKAMEVEDLGITVGAVCVYPNRVSDAVASLKAAGAPQIPVASVATGFPAGQTPLKTRLEEIRTAVEDGAREIDIVINRQMALTGNWKGVYDEVRLMKEACGEAHLKAILATGELGSLVNVYKASMTCMMAGADFIKTSTGKEGVNAILPVALVMVRAIREYFHKTGYKVGFKPAGGIRTAKEACTWLSLMKEELGDEWTKPELFRLGASSLLVGFKPAGGIRTAKEACTWLSLIKEELGDEWTKAELFRLGASSVLVGFKPAGGIRTAKEACTWLSLMKEELGDEWTKPELFRLGASSLLVDIERQLYHYVYGRYAASHEIPMS